MSVLRTCVLFLSSAGLLYVADPWEIYHRQLHFQLEQTIVSYAALIGILTIASAFIAPWIARKIRARSNKFPASLLNGTMTFGLLLLVTMLFSGLGLSLDIPRTRVRGIFFAEWNFTRFVFYVALPMSTLAAALEALNGKTATQRSPSK